jgi:hypothetical protein
MESQHAMLDDIDPTATRTVDLCSAATHACDEF